MKIHFIRHIFATVTYEHSISSATAWDSVSSNYNRYIQKLRRLHGCPVQYLRTLESHKNDYAHCHSILQFPDARIRVDNHKYFTPSLHAKWKLLWSHGLSDYQVPKTKGTSQLTYILKYIIKNQTSKTIWKKILKSQCVVNSADAQPSNTSTDSSENQFDFSVAPVSKNGAKLCSWSRNFDFKPFYQMPIK